MAEAAPTDNLYVSGLPAGTDDAFLKELFGATIKSCRVLPSKTPGKGNCVAMVKFTTTEQAITVRTTLDGQAIPGTECTLSIRYAGKPGGGDGSQYGKAMGGNKGGGGGMMGPSPYGAGGGKEGGVREKDNLYISGLPPGIDEDWIKQSFGEYGATVKQCKVLPVKKPGMPLHAMVRFGTEQEAENIKASFQGAQIEGTTIKIENVIKGGAAGDGGAKGGCAGGFGGGGCKGGYSKDFFMGKAGGKGKGKQMMSMDKIIQTLHESAYLPGSELMENRNENSLYVGGLPSDSGDVHLYQLCVSFGALAPKGCSVAKHPDGSCKGFGHAQFIDPTHLEFAQSCLNGMQLPDGTILKANAKPNPTAA